MTGSILSSENRATYFLISIIKQFGNEPQKLAKFCPELSKALKADIKINPFSSYIPKWEELKKWHPDKTRELKKYFDLFSTKSFFHDFVKRHHFESIMDKIDNLYSIAPMESSDFMEILSLDHRQMIHLFDMIGTKALLDSIPLLIYCPRIKQIDDFFSDQSNSVYIKYCDFWQDRICDRLKLNWSIWDQKSETIKAVIRTSGVKTFVNIRKQTTKQFFDLICKRTSNSIERFLRLIAVSKSNEYIKASTSNLFLANKYVKQNIEGVKTLTKKQTGSK